MGKKEILPLNESRISMGQDAEKKRAENSPQPVHLQAPTFKFFSLLMNETITFIFQTKAHERVKGGDSLIKGWVRMRHNKPSILTGLKTSLVAQMVMNPPAM